MKKNISSKVLKTRRHFEILDGLRGVAALAIVIFHFMEWIFTDFSKNFIGHGFLAVDFFFCLSGFVIAYAYDNRIKEMGVMEFFKSRLIRLHPMVFIGALIGLLAFLLDPFSSHLGEYSIGKIILIFACSIFLIPLPVMSDRSFNLFGLNAPSWSLFWEYVANIFYAFILCRLSRRVLIALAIIAAGLLCSVGFGAGNLLGGWAGSNFWHGGARVFYSFLAGLLIYRSNWIIKNRLGFIGVAILLSFAFLFPSIKKDWITELIIVLFYFPLLVSLGAGSSLSSASRKLCVFSGEISYPLYMSHYAAIWIFGAYLTVYKPGPAELTFVVIAGTILLVGFAYAIMKLYDVPVRKYLANRRLKALRLEAKADVPMC
jgi:peptidoglycan/LPS O-acetylase OafA/YrhL